MGIDIIILVLLVFMVIAALIAVETKSLLSSVISLGAVGFGLSITFLFLRAPDLAIVQIAVEVVLLIFLIRATINRETIPETGQIRWWGMAFVLLLLTAVLVFAYFAFRDLGDFGEPIITSVKSAPSNLYLREGLEQTGAANIVTSILLDYRAYDTLGEATLLFTAIIGALAILRSKAKTDKGGGKKMKGMSLIVKTVTRWVKVFIFLFGVYLIITGHLTPGGGFAGGVIIACSYILLTLAYGKDFTLKRFRTGVAKFLSSTGALLFLIVGLSALGSGGMFLSNYLRNNFPGEELSLLGSGTISIIDIAIGILVASSLFHVFIILSALRLVTGTDGGEK
jgi:multicomponent Na+:H+ antiporter subunit B